MAYEKQTWTTGDTVTADKLNHMEDGISSSYVVIFDTTIERIEDDGVYGVLQPQITLADLFELMKTKQVAFKCEYENYDTHDVTTFYIGLVNTIIKADKEKVDSGDWEYYFETGTLNAEGSGSDTAKFWLSDYYPAPPEA
ncbi:MAG: hypothetical protein J6S14_12045 [Clostridia bacterium]|nr:hypothetical protein [Clostridia bacterium]